MEERDGICRTRIHVHDGRFHLCSEDCDRVMDAWTDNSMETSTIINRLRKVIDLKRTSSDNAVVKDLNKANHVPIPYGKAPYRSRKANKILQEHQSTRPVARGTWIPGINDKDIIKPAHFIPSETPTYTLRQHQRRVMSASSCSKSLCSSFNSRFMLPGNISTSDSSSDEPIRTKEDTDVNIGSIKPSAIRKTKSMHAGTCQVIQVSECRETRFSTLPRKIQKVNSISDNKSSHKTVLNKVPVFDLDELDNSLTNNNNSFSEGLPGMCDVIPRPLSKNSNNCTCCSICEMMSPRLFDVNKNVKHSNCFCETCLYNLKEKPGLVQYQHGDVIKTFDWLSKYAKETSL